MKVALTAASAKEKHMLALQEEAVGVAVNWVSPWPSHWLHSRSRACMHAFWQERQLRRQIVDLEYEVQDRERQVLAVSTQVCC